ncbi:MAG: LCP family protein [Clostridia bacterium]|nr:LCP family protein [Clostridia bacterium]
MYKFKNVTFLLLLLLCGAFLVASCDRGESRDSMAKERPLTVLVAGLDDAAENTDVLMLVRFDPTASALSVLQIPRDTYFETEGYRGKINGLYPTYRYRKNRKEEALALLSEELSACLSVPIDRFVAVDTAAVSEIVDALGGVTLSLPAPIRYRDGEEYTELSAGEHTLTGREALQFLRFRSAYVEGDLGRVDAQKLLLAAAYRKAKEELTLTAALTLLPKLYDRILTDMPLTEQLSCAYAFYRDRDRFSVKLLTLPGEATQDPADGLWYYVANRRASAEALSLYFGGAEGFDPHTALCDEGRLGFFNIYNDKNGTYTVYTEETVDGLNIKTK